MSANITMNPLTSGPDSGSKMTYAVTCFTFSLALVTCLARFLARGLLIKSYGLDDIIMIGAITGSCFLTATIKMQFDGGVGKHASTLSIDQLSFVFRTAWISQIVYYWTINCCKLSILALYLRLVPVKGKYKVIIQVIFVIVAAQATSCIMGTIFLCTPVRAMWNVLTFPQGCINILYFNYFNASFGMLTDVVLTFLPLPLLWTLQINFQKKIALGIIFGCGLISIAGTVGRLIATITWSSSPDFTWTFTPVLLYTAIECNSAIISASLPSLRPLFKKLIDFGGSSGAAYELSDRPVGEHSGVRNENGAPGNNSNYSTKIRSHHRGLSTDVSRTLNESEENIIRYDNKSDLDAGTSHVVKTTEIQVHYS